MERRTGRDERHCPEPAGGEERDRNGVGNGKPGDPKGETAETVRNGRTNSPSSRARHLQIPADRGDDRRGDL